MTKRGRQYRIDDQRLQTVQGMTKDTADSTGDDQETVGRGGRGSRDLNLTVWAPGTMTGSQKTPGHSQSA
ncbi:unnamed protein product, partial [Staurois parvus]